jgi:hypothetical protein
MGYRVVIKLNAIVSIHCLMVKTANDFLHLVPKTQDFRSFSSDASSADAFLNPSDSDTGLNDWNAPRHIDRVSSRERVKLD